MKYISIYILLSINCLGLISSCSNSKELSYGLYKNKRCNPFFRLIHESRTNTTTTILADSTYILQACNIQRGFWQRSNDTLFLNCISNKFKNGSDKLIECPPHKIPLKIKSKKIVYLKGRARCYFLEK